MTIANPAQEHGSSRSLPSWILRSPGGDGMFRPLQCGVDGSCPGRRLFCRRRNVG